MNFQNQLWQSKLWEAFQRECGHETFRIQNTLIIVRPNVFGKKFFEIPRAEVHTFSQDFWNELRERAREKKAVFTRVFPADLCPSPLTGGTACPPKSIEDGQRRKGVPEIFPKHTLVINLAQTEEEILAQMKQKGRYNIRLAEKKGVIVTQSDDIDAFYSLLQQTTDRDGFSAHSQEVYAHMLSSFGDDALLLLAQYKNKVIAGGIFLFHKNVCTYYYGASSNHHRNIMAPYLLQWTAIQEAKKRGCTWFDFLGVAPENDANHQLSGVSQFKEKFGSIRVQYAPAFEVVHQKIPYYFLKSAQRIKKFLRH